MTGPPSGSSLERQLPPLCTLLEPTRRRLYRYVVEQSQPVTRDEASATLHIDRSLVAYHLDRLVEQGLLVATFARPEGRSGPRAGRPAKRYQRADGEFAVSVPARDYRLAAELLARAAEADRSGTVRRALDAAASDLGRELATGSDAHSTEDLIGVLRDQGFEPYEDGDLLRLRNCPFHRLVEQHTELVCGMNLALLSGLALAVDHDVRAQLDPGPGRCCVAFRIA